MVRFLKHCIMRCRSYSDLSFNGLVVILGSTCEKGYTVGILFEIKCLKLRSEVMITF